jgi:hypothetical protein
MALKIDNEKLEKTLDNDLNSKPNSKEECDCGDECKSSKEEIGYHKGSLSTLVAERNELVKMVINVEAIMKSHIKRLEELGIKIQAEERK